jgi:predicted TIM-barrel fold metal-dependent hydrolase
VAGEGSPAEAVLDPDLPIVDAHQHFWERTNTSYFLNDFLADLRTGHNVVATVFVECSTMYRATGPEELRPVGEVEFANGIAAMSASGLYGPVRIAEGIVAHADMTLGDRCRACAGSARSRRRRALSRRAPLGRLRRRSRDQQQPRRDGSADAARAGLPARSDAGWARRDSRSRPGSFIRSSMKSLTSPAPAPARRSRCAMSEARSAMDDTPAGKTKSSRRGRKKVTALATCPNVTMKLGGMMNRLAAIDYRSLPAPVSSVRDGCVLAPWMETCIELFGPQRCMFESNFPVDKMGTGWVPLWNAFKRIAAGASAGEKQALFSGTARRVYRLMD